MKLDMLFKRNLYDAALNMAIAQKLGDREVAEIHTHYGDHLCSKGDFDGAIKQYIDTIRNGKTYIEPSYVINRFLDNQRFDNLTMYLEALHANKCANKDHTTLLLNCFTKSKDIQKLDNFIKESTTQQSRSGERPNFDVDTAIHVCRQAGYFNHALLLAKQHRKVDLHLKILVEDQKEYAAAIDSVYALEILDAESIVRQYGQEMMLQEPAKMTELLKKMCTNFKPRIESKEKEMELKLTKSESKDTPIQFVLEEPLISVIFALYQSYFS
jgi:hypothetical protein